MVRAGIQGAIVDLDGTVYRGEHLLPGADDGVRALRSAGVSVLFLTNKPIERRETFSRKLNDLGVPAEADDVLTSAWLTATYLRRAAPESRSLVVGEQPLVDELRAADLVVTDDPDRADTVVASMDRSFDYETLTRAMRAVDGAARFIATNPDRTCPVSDGVIPDAAGMIGAIEGVTGRAVDHVVGKPSETTVEAAMTRLDTDPTACLLVGDRLETDIVMGNRAGMTTVLVLTGVTDRETVADSEVEPDYVVESLGEIRTVL